MHVINKILKIALVLFCTNAFSQSKIENKLQPGVFIEGGMVFNQVGTERADTREKYTFPNTKDFEAIGVNLKYQFNKNWAINPSFGIGRYNYTIPYRADVLTEYNGNPPILYYKPGKYGVGTKLLYLEPMIEINRQLLNRNNNLSIDLAFSYPIFVTKLYNADDSNVEPRMTCVVKDFNGIPTTHHLYIYNRIGNKNHNRLLSAKIGFTYKNNSSDFLKRLSFSVFATTALVNANAPSLQLVYKDMTNNKVWGNEKNYLSNTKFGLRITYDFNFN